MIFWDWFWIAVIVITILIGVVFFIYFIAKKTWLRDRMVLEAVFSIIISLAIATLVLFGAFVRLDYASGATAGIVTSVDSTKWGKKYIYIKTSETTQEVYCIEAENVNDFGDLNSYIGKTIKVTYGTRVGVYSIGKCSQSPIETIEIMEKQQ